MVKYDANGPQLWVARYDGPAGGSDVPTGLASDTHGDAYVTGYSYGLNGVSDYATVKYDADGQQQWVARYNGLAYATAAAAAVAVDSEGSVVVAGSSGDRIGGFGYAILK